MSETRKEVELVVRLTFEGDYYDAAELVDVSSGWIHAGLEDRDNLTGQTITGRVLSETPLKAKEDQR